MQSHSITNQDTGSTAKKNCLGGNSKNLKSIIQKILAFFSKERALDVVVIVVVKNFENAENKTAAAEATKKCHTTTRSHSHLLPDCDSLSNHIVQN